MFHSRKSRLLLSVAVAALAACGGGGGDSTPATTSIAGAVVKGPASKAKVTVFATNADGTQGAELGRFTTVGKGAFNGTIPVQTRPVIIVADLEGADIEDETKTPTVTYKGKAGEVMRALMVPGAGSTMSFAVTPFSEMAYHLAKNAGSFSSDNVTTANAKIRAWVAGDHLSPSVAADLLPQLTAVQKLVNGNASGLQGVLAAMSAAARFNSNGAFVIDSTFSTQLQAACTGACGTFASPVVGAEPMLPVTTLGTIASVKSLFKDLRDTLNAYSSGTNTGDLDKATDRLKLAMDSATSPVDDEMLMVIARVGDAEKLYRDFKAGVVGATQARDYDYTAYGRISTVNSSGQTVQDALLPRVSCYVAQASFTTLATGELDVATFNATGVTAANANAFSCYGNGMQGRLVGTDLGDGFARYQSMIVIPQTDGSYKYVHQTRKVAFNQFPASAHSRVVAKYGTLTMSRLPNGEISGFNLQGQLAPGLKHLPAHTVAGYQSLQRVDASLALSYSNAVGTDTVGLSGSLKLIKADGTEASSVTIATGSGFVVKTGTPNLDDALSSMSLDVTVAVPGAKAQGIVTAAGARFDQSGTVYQPTQGSFQGKVFEADGAGYRLLLDGKFTANLQNYAAYNESLPQVGSNTLVISGDFVGKILLKDRPEMSLVMTGTKHSPTRQRLSGTFIWNNKTLAFTGTRDDLSTAAGANALVVSNSDGVTFTVPKGGEALPQDIFKGGIKVGTIALKTSRIDYIDGTFEQY